MNSVLEVPVRGSDDADVNAYGPAAADRLELLLLQDAQQLDLRVERHLDDLAEIVLGLDLLLQVQVLSLQPIAQPPQLFVRQAMVQSDGNSTRDLLERSAAQILVGSRSGGHEEQGTQAALPRSQRQCAER